MDRPLRFSELSPDRKILVRLCQSINYGRIQNLKVEDQEPVLLRLLQDEERREAGTRRRAADRIEGRQALTK